MKRITLLITFISLLCISIKAQYYNVTVHINAGELKDSLTEEQLSRVQDLVVSGSMNYDDLALIQNRMPKLKFVNLRDVDLDTIPKKAFYSNEQIWTFKLPLYIKYLDDYSFDKSDIGLVVTGLFPKLGEDVGGFGISISPDNEFCKRDYGCIYSMDGKIMYRYSNEGILVVVVEGTEVIASRAFEKTKIRCIIFPSTLLEIEENAFKNTYLANYIEDSYHSIPPVCMIFESEFPPTLAKNVFGMDEYTRNCYIKVPKGSRKLYQEADPQWKLFKIYEEGEPEPDTAIGSLFQSGLIVRVFGSSLTVNSEQAITRVEVFNSVGKLVTSDVSNTLNVIIPFADKYKGLYVVKVYYRDQTFEIVKVIN